MGTHAVTARRVYVPPHLRKRAAPKESSIDAIGGAPAAAPLSDGETSAGSSSVSDADVPSARRTVRFAARSQVEEVARFDYTAVGEDWAAIGEERAWRFRTGQLARELREHDRADCFTVWRLHASQARARSLA